MANSIATAWITVKPSTEGMMNSLGSDFKAMGANIENQGTSLANKFAARFGVVSELAGKAVNKATELVSDAIGAAVQRSDVMLQFSRTFENLGFSAQTTKDTINAVSDSIKGLPTRLDDAAQSVVFLTSSMDNDPKQATKMFAALNDAVLGFGGTATDAARITRLLGEAFTGGRVDARRWNEMLNAGMGPALNMVAEKMHITSDELKKGMGQGKISAKAFQDALIELDSKGVGSMKSLHDIALDSTKGIGTSFVNMQTAISRGLANILDSLRNSGVDIAGAIQGVGTGFENVEKMIAGVITSDDAKRIINDVKDIVQKIGDGFNELVKHIDLSAISQSMKTMFDTLKKEAEPIRNVFKTIKDSFGGGKEAAGKFGDALTQLMKVASIAIPSIATAFVGFKIGGVLQTASTGLMAVRDAFRIAAGAALDSEGKITIFKNAIKVLNTETELSGFTGAISGAFSKLGAFIAANPVGVALGAIGAITGVFMYLNSKTEEAKKKQDALKQAIQGVRDTFEKWAGDNNKDIGLEQASLDAENAERNYQKLAKAAEDAKAKFGENSDAYIEASANLKQADIDRTTANDNLTQKQNEHNQVLADAKTKADEFGQSIKNMGGDADTTNQQIDNLHQKIDGEDYQGAKDAMTDLQNNFNQTQDNMAQKAAERSEDIKNHIISGAPTDEQLDNYRKDAEAIAGFFQKACEKIKGFFDWLWSQVQKIFPGNSFLTVLGGAGLLKAPIGGGDFTPDWATTKATRGITPFATGIGNLSSSIKKQAQTQEFPRTITLVDQNGSLLGRMRTIAEMAVA